MHSVDIGHFDQQMTCSSNACFSTTNAPQISSHEMNTCAANGHLFTGRFNLFAEPDGAVVENGFSSIFLLIKGLFHQMLTNCTIHVPEYGVGIWFALQKSLAIVVSCFSPEEIQMTILVHVHV